MANIIDGLLGNFSTIALIAIAIAVFGGMYVLASRYRTVPPNVALIISGSRGTRVITGGGTLVLPLIETARALSLEIMTVDIKKEAVHTVSGVPVDFTGVIQFKVAGKKK